MFEKIDTTLNNLSSGALLTSGNEPCNVMTIGWGFVGFMWRKKVIAVAIRESRLTKEFVDKTGEFGLSIPKSGEMRQEIKLCGTKSGREVDKISMIKTKNATKIGTKLVDGCELYYECKVLAAIPMNKDDMNDNIKEFYADDDMHVLYIAEIL